MEAQWEVSLDGLLEQGYDVGDKYELQARDGLVREDIEEPEQ